MGDRELEQLRHPARCMDHHPVRIGMTKALPLTAANLWDKDFNHKFSIDADLVTTDGADRTVTLPVDHPAARWLIDDVPNERGANLTIDGPNGRWSGPLAHFKVFKVGDCPQCAHCQARGVKSVWRMPFSGGPAQ
jgi:hypothetical protein